ncbi:unnamed protein product, partial [Symbiodinium sp. CCMP2592]
LVFVACHPLLEASRHCQRRGLVTRSVAVDTDFEGAAVEVMQIAGNLVQLRLLPDGGGRHPKPKTGTGRHCSGGRHPGQWFYFRASRLTVGELYHFRLDVSGARAWRSYKGYEVCASYTGDRWCRCLGTLYDSEARMLFWDLKAEASSCFFAYFEPYGLDQLESLLKEAADAGAERRTMGRTTDGRSIDALCFPAGLLQTGREPAGEPALVWITCRQHAAETQASFFAEGVVRSVLSEPLPLSLAIVLVPNVNPDGSVRGHTRENAQGVDLNREWRPKADYSQNGRSPEVSALQAAMLDTGVDVHLDVHGDEAADTAYSYPGLPRFRAPAHVAKLFDELEAELHSRSGGFYVPRPGSGSARTAAFWTGTQFGALSLTLEMPYKDSEQRKASSESCRRLGGVAVDAIRSLGPRLPRFRLSRKRP